MERKQFFAWDLVLVLIFTIITFVFITVPVLSSTVPRTILGLFLIIFIPGYAFIAALFPKNGDLNKLERLILSFGSSIVITPMLGLILNYTPYGISLESGLLALSSLTVILVFIAYLRRVLTTPVNRFKVDLSGFKSLGTKLSRESLTGKISSAILILSILLAISATVYVIFEPKPEVESFTQFYILGSDGMLSDYPINLTSGETGNLTIGIVNHENKQTTYNLVVTSDGIVQTNQIITLNNNQSVQIPFNFTAGQPGNREMVFNLYKSPDDNNIYRNLHLWLNIT
ncbi:MAG: DUF1616 domain-containing protein [Methanobacterium sp.]